MIKVRIQSNSVREEQLVAPTSTLRSVLDAAGVQYQSCTVNLDGMPLKAGDLDKTFADFGVTEVCWLTGITKQDNN